MTKFENVFELWSKVDWEGGLVDAILGYGIRVEELPVGTPQEIIEAWERIEAMDADVNLINTWLEDNNDE